MKKFQTLIAAVDFTSSCRNALREAVRIASANGGRITAVHVMEEGLAEELKKALAASQATVRAEWENRLRKFVEDSDITASGGSAGGAFVEMEVRIGHVFAELAEACRVRRADLLVMGVKGADGGAHRVGVIAAKCVRKAPADVLLISDDSRGPFRHIVTCVDFSDNSAKAVQHALEIARQDGASVDCVHVYQSALALSLDYGGLAAPMPVGADAETLEHWNRELENFIRPLVGSDYAGVPVTLRVIERVNIREAIVDHVNERRADLVVLGTRGKTGLRELLIGTTAEKVVSNAPCSILAVKPDETD